MSPENSLCFCAFFFLIFLPYLISLPPFLFLSGPPPYSSNSYGGGGGYGQQQGGGYGGR